MRCITYAGETVVTTDEVGRVLVDLTAELAKRGRAEAVTIPIVLQDDDGTVASADLVIGLGNDVLSVPTSWQGDQPDFSEGIADLKAHLDQLLPSQGPVEPDDASYAPEPPESILSDLDLNTSDFK